MLEDPCYLAIVGFYIFPTFVFYLGARNMTSRKPFSRRKRWLLIVLLADFIIIAAVVGPLSNRYSSPILTTLSVIGIVVFVCCMILLGRIEGQRNAEKKQK